MIEFKNKANALNKEFMERLNTREREVITDGVMMPELYFKNGLRLAWMLKEPYDSKNGIGGGWSMFDMFPEEKDLYEEQFKRTHKVTWQPIIYISFSIFNNFQKWSEMKWISEDHSMCDIVRQVAFINSQKLPSKGVTRTDYTDLEESLKLTSDLLEKQINLCNPNVFIFANTVGLYTNILGYKLEEFVNEKSVSYLFKDGKLFINAYHPGQRKIKREDYVNDIVSIVEKFSDKLK